MLSSRIIVFDLYETLIHEPDYSWNRVYQYLIKEVFTSNPSLEEVTKYCFEYWAPKYRDRGCNEIDIEDELNDLINRYGIKEDLTLSDVTLNCLYEVGRCCLFDDTIDVLNELTKLGFEIHLLSNCIYHKKQMIHLLDKFAITKYFTSIHFSSDYMVRKPCDKFFNVVINDVKNRYSNIDIKDIIFSGDNFEADIMGAHNSGLQPIFINRKNQDLKELENKYNLKSNDYIVVNNLTQLLEKVKEEIEA